MLTQQRLWETQRHLMLVNAYSTKIMGKAATLNTKIMGKTVALNACQCLLNRHLMLVNTVLPWIMGHSGTKCCSTHAFQCLGIYSDSKCLSTLTCHRIIGTKRQLILVISPVQRCVIHANGELYNINKLALQD